MLRECCSFGIVRSDRLPLDLDHFDLIFLEPLAGAGMMKFCVAVGLSDRTHLPSLFPERRAFAQSEGEALLAEPAQ